MAAALSSARLALRAPAAAVPRRSPAVVMRPSGAEIMSRPASPWPAPDRSTTVPALSVTEPLLLCIVSEPAGRSTAASPSFMVVPRTDTREPVPSTRSPVVAVSCTLPAAKSITPPCTMSLALTCRRPDGLSVAAASPVAVAPATLKRLPTARLASAAGPLPMSGAVTASAPLKPVLLAPSKRSREPACHWVVAASVRWLPEATVSRPEAATDRVPAGSDAAGLAVGCNPLLLPRPMLVATSVALPLPGARSSGLSRPRSRRLALPSVLPAPKSMEP